MSRQSKYDCGPILVADEHRVADLERLRMKDEHAHADLHTIAEPLAERAKHDAARALPLRAIDPQR